jgi:hypothetical protein
MRRREKLPKCSCSSRHDKNGCLIFVLELVKGLLPLRERAVAIELKIWDLGFIQVS